MEVALAGGQVQVLEAVDAFHVDDDVVLAGLEVLDPVLALLLRDVDEIVGALVAERSVIRCVIKKRY